MSLDDRVREALHDAAEVVAVDSDGDKLHVLERGRRLTRRARVIRVVMGTVVLALVVGVVFAAVAIRNPAGHSASPRHPSAIRPLRGSVGAPVVALDDGYDGVIYVDTATGVTMKATVSGKAPGDALVRFVERNGQLVLAGGTNVVTVPVNLQGAPRTIANASYFLPSADNDRLWIVRYIRNGSTGTATGTEIQEFDLSGTAVTAPTTLAPNDIPEGATSNGLAVEVSDTLEFWAASGRLVPLFGSTPSMFVASNGSSVAWCITAACTSRIR